ncbi:hypothetical protein V1478_013869, partial [Vespula squamosa]
QRLPTGVAQGATVNGQRGKYAAADPISNSTLGEIDGCVCAGETIASLLGRHSVGTNESDKITESKMFEPGHAQTIVSTVRMVDRWEEVGRVDCAREGRLSRLDEYPQGRPWRENESSTCYGKPEYPRCESQTFLPRFGDNFVIAAMNFRGVDFRLVGFFPSSFKEFLSFLRLIRYFVTSVFDSN